MHSWVQSEAGHNACPSLARHLPHAENASGVTSGLKEKPSDPCVPPLDVQIWMAWGKTNQQNTNKNSPCAPSNSCCCPSSSSPEPFPTVKVMVSSQEQGYHLHAHSGCAPSASQSWYHTQGHLLLQEVGL